MVVTVDQQLRPDIWASVILRKCTQQPFVVMAAQLDLGMHAHAEFEKAKRHHDHGYCPSYWNFSLSQHLPDTV